MNKLFIDTSGTSRDSLDACLVDFTDHFEIVAAETLDFSYYKTSMKYLKLIMKLLIEV